MTDEVELLNMIFQHMFLSGKTDVDRCAFHEGSGALPSLSAALLLWNALQRNLSSHTSEVTKAKHNDVTLNAVQSSEVILLKAE